MPYSEWKSFRYWLVRLWACPIPGVKYDWPIIGGRTIPEVIAMIGIVAGCIAAGVSGDAGFTGNLTSYVAFALIFFAIRSNFILVHLFNISFERGLVYHKVIGIVIMALVLIHAIGEGISTTGIILGIALLGAPLVYAFEYFLGKFNFFYYPHVTLTIVAIPVSFLHGATDLGIALLIWLGDLFVRYVIRGKKATAQAQLVGDDIVCLEIDMKENWYHEAGQYCFLMVPAINMVEYHPFTIASSPTISDTKIAFYVKRSGDWTEKLAKLVQAQIPVTNRGKDVEESKLNVTATISLPVYLEGPYGVLSVDLANAQVYETVVLIAGGVGITPITALFSKLLSQKNNKGSQHKRELHLIWSARDPALAEFILQHVITTQLLAHGFMLSVAEENGKEDCCAVYQRPGMAVLKPNNVVVEDDQAANDIAMVHIADRNSTKIIPAESSTNGRNDDYVTETVHLHIHFSAKEILETTFLNNMQCIVYGRRPDFEEIFAKIAARTSSKGGDRVGVAVCGPIEMVGVVRDLCNRTVTYCCSNGEKQLVSFDCHEEVFKF